MALLQLPYIFTVDLMPSLNGLGIDNYKTRQETFKFWDLVSYIRGFVVYELLGLNGLIHYGIVMSYGDIDMGQYQLK